MGVQAGDRRLPGAAHTHFVIRAWHDESEHTAVSGNPHSTSAWSGIKVNVPYIRMDLVAIRVASAKGTDHPVPVRDRSIGTDSAGPPRLLPTAVDNLDAPADCIGQRGIAESNALDEAPSVRSHVASRPVAGVVVSSGVSRIGRP